MGKTMILEEGWDPDKYRDELCERRWRKSGAKTGREYMKWLKDNELKLLEKLRTQNHVLNLNNSTSFIDNKYKI
jgi:hypothetical protein